jgi:hypothetical protein
VRYSEIRFRERLFGAILMVVVALAASVGAIPAQAQMNPCPYTNDGDCDEPEGLGFCAEGTDVVDCSNPNSNYGTGSGYSGGGTGGSGALHNPCPYTNDGDCDEPEGLGFCAEGTDVVDCSNPNSNYGQGIGYQGGVQGQPCPEGFALINGACQPVQTFVCPQGYDFVNGSCQPTQQATCPAGLVLMNGACQPDPCPEGYAFDNGACQPTQQDQSICPVGQVLMNGACQPDPCPQGFAFTNGSCQPAQQSGQQPGQPPAGDQACPAGQVSILGVCQSATGTPVD